MQVAIQMGIPLKPDHIGGINHVYGYVNQNPLSYIDPYGLICLTCQAQGSGGGAGRDSNGKMCNYNCRDEDGNEKTIPGGSDDYGNGNELCYGANAQTGTSPSGDIYPYANGFNDFEIDTDSWWDKWRKPTLTGNASKAFE